MGADTLISDVEATLAALAAALAAKMVSTLASVDARPWITARLARTFSSGSWRSATCNKSALASKLGVDSTVSVGFSLLSVSGGTGILVATS